MLNNELNETQRITPNVEEAKELLSTSFLDKLTQTNVYSYYSIYGTLFLYFSYLALTRITVSSFIFTFFTGLFLWSFTEYCMHRFSFHLKSSNPFLKLSTFIFHGVHHAYPREVSRSLTPLIFSLPLAAIFYIIFKMIFKGSVDGIFSGFLSGYLIYTIIHDSTHHFSMNYPVLRQLKRHHMHHHYFDTNGNFGVSSPLWDFVFGTHVKVHQARKPSR